MAASVLCVYREKWTAFFSPQKLSMHREILGLCPNKVLSGWDEMQESEADVIQTFSLITGGLVAEQLATPAL